MAKEVNKIFNASDKLNHWISKVASSTIYEIFFITLIFLLFISLMIRDSNNIVWILIGILGLLVYYLLFFYAGTIRRARVLNSTIKKVDIKDEIILIETFQSKIPFFKRPPIKIVADLNDVKILAKQYPISDKKGISDNNKSIFINGKEFFLLIDYFDDELLKKL